MKSRRTLIALVLASGAALALGWSVPAHLTIDPAAVRHESGFCYVAKVSSRPHAVVGAPSDSISHPQRSGTVLMENGKDIGIAHSAHDDIRQKGGGRFSHWKHGDLYFSSSDGSDPRTNGKQYSVTLKIMLAGWPRAAAWIVLLMAAWVWLAGVVPAAAHYALRRPRTFFWISCALVTVTFVSARLPWLLDLRLPFIQYDTPGYFVPVRQIFSGHWPAFDNRTPGYPIFLAAALAMVPKLTFILVLQVVLSYLSILFFLYAIYRTAGRLVLLAGVAMAAHASQPMLVIHDFTLLTESLFTSLFLIFLGSFILATRKPRGVTLFLTSLVCGYAIFVRPAGIFMAGVLLLGVFYLVRKKEKPVRIAALAVPVAVLLLALMAYNYFSRGVFAFSTVGNLTRAGVTATYWETDESFPDDVNAAIREFKKEIPPNESRTLAGSWDPHELQLIFQRWAGHVIYVCEHTVRLINHQPRYSDLVASKAVRTHPKYALKFFYSTLWCFLAEPPCYRVSMYADVKWILSQMYVEGTATDPFIGREFSRLPARRALKIADKAIVVDPKALRGEKLDAFVREADRRFFDQAWWHAVYFVVLLICAARLVRTRFIHWGTFILFSICCALLGAGIVVAATTTMSNRYPAPTRFVEVLSLCLLPLLWQPREPGRKQEGCAGSAEQGMFRNSQALSATARNYYRWNLSVFPVGEGKRILDIGCGPCLYLEAILDRRPALYLATDCSPGFLEMTAARIKGHPNCRAEYLDILDGQDPKRVLSDQRFDHVLCFDVIEHLPDDQAALKKIREVMSKTGGELFVRVPALPMIFGANDEAIGHYRRYTKASLKAVLEASGFEVKWLRYQNLAGVLPWLVIGRLFRRSLAVAPGEGRLFDKAVPVLRWAENAVPPPVGLSVYGVAGIRT